MSRLPRPLLYYGSAVVSVALATLLRMLVDPILGQKAPYATFFVASLVVAWYAGVGPSLLALALGAGSAIYFFVPPQDRLVIANPADWVSLGVYLFVGASNSAFSGALRAAQSRAEASAREAWERQRQWEREAEQHKQALEALRHATAGAQCVLWHAEVEDREGTRLRWTLHPFDVEAAERFFPVEIPPNHTYVDAFYESRPREDKVRMGEYANREVRAGRSYRQEFRYRRRDGELRWLAEDVQIETLGPGRWRAVGVCTDITRLKEIAAELHKANQAKDDFLSMLAHELRNPLAPIRNAVELLHRSGPDEPRIERAREIIERQMEHLVRLVDDLLDVSRITRNKIALQREPLDLADLVRDAVEVRHGFLETAGLTLALDLPREPIWVEGDATRITQIVSNVLHNAVKYSDPGGAVTVCLDTDGGSGRARICVRDTGIGIDAELLPRIFESFTQADRSLDRSQGGLGLGLALVKGLVELHGGEVRAASPGLGQGAEFTILLPKSSAPAAPVEAPALPVTVASAASRRVLVVEDNEDAAETFRDLLELFGCTVEVAYTGPAGLEAAHRFAPETVLCDIGLPGLDGYEVARALRQAPATTSALLVAVTGYGQEEDRRRAREAGFDLHLTKPVQPAELQKLFERAPQHAHA